jgi:hypothetical protein
LSATDQSTPLLKAPSCGGGLLTSEERGTSTGFAALAESGASKPKVSAAAKAGKK